MSNIKLTKEQVLSIKTYRLEGKTTKEIATILGVTPASIGYWVRRLKVSGHDVTTTAKSKGRTGMVL